MDKILVTVIGEMCTDKFIYGDVARLCPEAPVPVLKPFRVVENPGMAGNVVENIKAINKNCEINFITQETEITKTRFVDEKSNQMIVRVDEGEDIIAPLVLTESIINKILLSDIVIVSDYNKGFLTDDVISKIAYYAKISILDSKRKLSNLFKQFDFIKLNKSERDSQTNSDIDNLNIITTLGKHGAEFNGVVYPSKNPRDTIDVSGAGDTFTSAFILKYFETADVEKSIDFGNLMASDVVSRRGVVVPK
jgi:D-beta-D-heptose 7-phosphate kinase/D-beta-D-heptose 1-phosphate adenosyltransferase